MVMPIFVDWDNPWLSPVNHGDPPPRTFAFSGVTNVNAVSGAVPDDWWLGVRATEIQVTFTCASPRTMEFLVYEDPPTTLIAGDTFAVSAGTHTVSLPIASQSQDLKTLSVSFGGATESGDSLDDIVVVTGPVILPEFWTSFTKSYEIP